MTDGPIERDPPGQRISYAQNGEDVRLWRAFEGIEEGFYVEVGGFQPEVDSISRSFYGRGWSGLVFEPVAEYAAEYARRRPRDDVRALAVGSEPGVVEFHAIPGTGLSTTSPQHAGRHGGAGFAAEVRHVEVVRLDDVLASMAPSDIHFMVIDVEGAEADVLAGVDLGTHRPWVLIIESTLPLTTTQNHQAWEAGVLAAGYEFVAFDGINRYYVAQEHADLATAIAIPPNVLDEFQRWDQATVSDRMADLRAELSQWQARAAEVSAAYESQVQQLHRLQRDIRDCEDERGALTRELGFLREERARLQSDLSAVLASRSWRVTAPLRRLGGPR